MYTKSMMYTTICDVQDADYAYKVDDVYGVDHVAKMYYLNNVNGSFKVCDVDDVNHVDSVTLAL